MSDPIEELKTMIQESIIANKAMHEATATRMASDARANVEQVATMKAEVKAEIAALSNGLTNLNQQFVEVKKSAEGAVVVSANAERSAKKAMESYDDIQVANQEQWRGVIAGQELIMKGLQEQNEEKKRSEQALKEERARESEAAKRVAEQKEKEAELAAEEREKIRFHKESSQKIWAPVWQAIVVAALTAAGGYLAIRAGHQDTDAKMAAQTQQLTNLQKKIESVAQVIPEQANSPALPAATVPASIPPSPHH